MDDGYPALGHSGEGQIQVIAEARRVDQAIGVVEEAEFFGSGSESLFGIRYLPVSGVPSAGIVMCDPILAQFRAHYRTGVLTARALAARGIAVQRFHYRGMGNSDGAIDTMSLPSMTEDARDAASNLVRATGSAMIGFLGINLGSYPAAVASYPSAPLILDSPPPNGHQYFRNALRAHAVYKLRRDSSDSPTMAGLHDELRQEGSDVALLGCRVSLGLYESLVSASVVEAVGAHPRPVLLIGLGEARTLRPEGEKLRVELEASGFSVDIEAREKVDPFWYVENSAPEDQPETLKNADRVVEWLHGIVVKESNGQAGSNA